MRRRLLLAQYFSHPIAQLDVRWLRPGLQPFDKGTNDLPIMLVLEADDDGARDGRMRYEPLLNFEGIDVFSAYM